MDNFVIAATTTVVNHRLVSLSFMLHLIVAMVTCKILIVAVNSIFAVATSVAHASIPICFLSRTLQPPLAPMAT